MDVAIKRKLPDWPFRFLNQWLCNRSDAYSHWNDGTNLGFPATRIHRACRGSELDWIAMAAVAAVKSDYWRKADCDFFACGLGGSFNDQLVNASTQWQNHAMVDELKLNENEIRQVGYVYTQMFKYVEAMAHAEEDEPLPQPPPPAPPKPVPPPPEPPKPQPEQPKPQPVPQPPAGDWKKQWKWIGGVASAILAMWIIIGNFLPPGVGAVVKMILKVLEGVFQ